jgi:hypothetical protein
VPGYRERVTPWFDLLNVSPDELERLVPPCGWRVATILPGDAQDFYAVLEKSA